MTLYQTSITFVAVQKFLKNTYTQYPMIFILVHRDQHKAVCHFALKDKEIDVNFSNKYFTAITVRIKLTKGNQKR